MSFAAATHDVLIAHELAAVDAAEAMLIGGLAVGARLAGSSRSRVSK